MDSHFIFDFDFTAEHVSVTYSGPVCFNLEFVQPVTPHTFESEDVFDTASGDWDLSDGKFWPVDEALIIVDYGQNWDRIMLSLHAIEREHILEMIEDLLKEGFKNLMRMLKSSNQE